MAIAVTDEAAEVFAERMAGCLPRVLRRAIRKAYMAAMQRDITTFLQEDRERGKALGEWGDQQPTHLGGSVVTRRGGECSGGVGVGMARLRA